MISTNADFDRSRHEASKPRVPFGRSTRALIWLAVHAAFALGIILSSRNAHAIVNAGIEVGAIKRSADAPYNLKLGVGYGLHAELDLLPLLKVGPYFLHYQLSRDDSSLADATFNTIGLRARLFLPIPIGPRPYAYVGAGYSSASYALPVGGDVSGHFVEIPLGIGIAFPILPLLQGSLDAAYRPAVGFGGDAYGLISKPESGYSVMLGIALDL
jgi:hypothetical protein